MIGVMGDVMLDRYSFGKVDRISPEAPVPVLHVTKEENKIGGAGNVAKNIVALGEKAVLFSVTGEDAAGRIIRERLNELGVLFNIKNDKNRPTIIKHRFIAEEYNQQLLRADYETIEDIPKDIADSLLDTHLLKGITWMVISDYGKGVVTKHVIDRLKAEGIRLIVDPKPKNIHSYKDVFLVKPNLKETEQIIRRKINNVDRDIEEAAHEIQEITNSNIVITRGSKGVTVLTKDGEIYHIPSHPVQVYDVTGAGDTFIATLTFGLSKGLDIIEATRLANKASAIVVTKLGAATVSLEELGVNL